MPKITLADLPSTWNARRVHWWTPLTGVLGKRGVLRVEDGSVTWDPDDGEPVRWSVVATKARQVPGFAYVRLAGDASPKWFAVDESRLGRMHWNVQMSRRSGWGWLLRQGIQLEQEAGGRAA